MMGRLPSGIASAAIPLAVFTLGVPAVAAQDVATSGS